MGKLIIDGNSVYEIDEECVKQKEEKERNLQNTEYQRKQNFEKGRKMESFSQAKQS